MEDNIHIHTTPARPEGRLFVVAGPSGVGKDTLVQRLVANVAGLKESVSATTRAPRDGEVEGVHYYFVEKYEFEEWIENDLFLEWAPYGTNLYGTPSLPVRMRMATGFDTVAILEVVGASAVKAKNPNLTITIFIKPPSLEELERRLRARHTDSEQSIQARLETARHEIEQAQYFDYVIVNDDADIAYEKLLEIVTRH